MIMSVILDFVILVKIRHEFPFAITPGTIFSGNICFGALRKKGHYTDSCNVLIFKLHNHLHLQPASPEDLPV